MAKRTELMTNIGIEQNKSLLAMGKGNKRVKIIRDLRRDLVVLVWIL